MTIHIWLVYANAETKRTPKGELIGKFFSADDIPDAWMDDDLNIRIEHHELEISDSTWV